jgi:hypothetical protein
VLMNGLDKNVWGMDRMMRGGCLPRLCLDGDGKFSGINGVRTVSKFCYLHLLGIQWLGNEYHIANVNIYIYIHTYKFMKMYDPYLSFRL